MKIEELVYSHYEQLNETDRSIWKYISHNKDLCSTITINKLASYCLVSRTTITRFVQKIGLKSFSEFKVYLQMEKDDSPIKDDSFERACDSIIKYVENQKKADLEDICEALYDANNLYAYGSGDMQMSVVKQLKRMFLSCDEVIYNVEGLTFDESFYHVIKPGDIMILVSLSGNNERIVNIAKRLKDLDVKILSITEMAQNKLTELSDYSLFVYSANLSFLKTHPKYQITTLFYILVELLFIKFSIYKKKRMIQEGLDASYI